MSAADPVLTVAGLRIHPNLFARARGERCVLAECRGACCVNGIWVDVLHVQRILDHAEAIKPFLAPEYRNEDEWFGEEELECADFPSGLGIPTAVGPRPGDPARQGCVFLRPDHTCGLQVASAELGHGWPGLKPFDCASYPVLRSDGELRFDEQSKQELGGADCQRECEGRPRRRFEEFRTEIELAIGRAGFEVMRQASAKMEGE